MKTQILALGAAATVLAACSTSPVPRNPVVLYTDQGPVTCELYMDTIVWWDRSVSHPDTMSEEVADGLCVEEGRKQSQNPTGGSTDSAAVITQ